MIVVAFDVDGTLIDYEDKPRFDIIHFLKLFHNYGCRIVVWSGSGKEYAARWVDRLDLNPDVDFVTAKGRHIIPDITFDDAEVDLGKVNIKVGTDDYPERW